MSLPGRPKGEHRSAQREGTPWTTAQSLLERFAVFGRYCEAELDGRLWPLRSHLEIIERGVDAATAMQGDADLVAVMMNPGASRPLAELDAQGWAPALPDRTQYQLMKLALEAQSMGWPLRHIRVINLSDLRTPKSAALFEALATLRDDRHSLFSAARRAELERALGATPVPVLRAWGLGRALDGLARCAVVATAPHKVLGLTDNDLHYRHPLPQRADFQREWLERMRGQLSLHAQGLKVGRARAS